MLKKSGTHTSKPADSMCIKEKKKSKAKCSLFVGCWFYAIFTIVSSSQRCANAVCLKCLTKVSEHTVCVPSEMLVIRSCFIFVLFWCSFSKWFFFCVTCKFIKKKERKKNSYERTLQSGRLSGLKCKKAIKQTREEEEKYTNHKTGAKRCWSFFAIATQSILCCCGKLSLCAARSRNKDKAIRNNNNNKRWKMNLINKRDNNTELSGSCVFVRLV